MIPNIRVTSFGWLNMVSDISATLGLSEIKILFLPIEWMYLTPAFIGAEIKVIFLSTFWKN